jgi:hypothetical protein
MHTSGRVVASVHLETREAPVASERISTAISMGLMSGLGPAPSALLILRIAASRHAGVKARLGPMQQGDASTLRSIQATAAPWH